MTLRYHWPHFCGGHMCDSTQGSFSPRPMKICQSMWIQWPFFFKNLNQRSLNSRWPLTQSLLRSHVWLYPLTSKHGWQAAPKNWSKAAAILVQSKSRRSCTTFNEGPMGHSRIWSKCIFNTRKHVKKNSVKYWCS